MRSVTDMTAEVGAMPRRMKQNPRHLVLAQRLADTADSLEFRAQGGNFVEEDAVVVLRWAADFLRREQMREDDLAGTLTIFRRVLPDFDALISGVVLVSSKVETTPPRCEGSVATAARAGAGAGARAVPRSATGRGGRA